MDEVEIENIADIEMVEIGKIENDEDIINLNENAIIEIKKCTICLGEISPSIWKCKQCGGEFHKICIRGWIESHVNYPFSYTCPLCNQIIRTRICRDKKGCVQCVQIILITIILTLCSILFCLFTSTAGMIGWLIAYRQ